MIRGLVQRFLSYVTDLTVLLHQRFQGQRYMHNGAVRCAAVALFLVLMITPSVFSEREFPPTAAFLESESHRLISPSCVEDIGQVVSVMILAGNVFVRPEYIGIAGAIVVQILRGAERDQMAIGLGNEGCRVGIIIDGEPNPRGPLLSGPEIDAWLIRRPPDPVVYEHSFYPKGPLGCAEAKLEVRLSGSSLDIRHEYVRPAEAYQKGDAAGPRRLTSHRYGAPGCIIELSVFRNP